jgi:hypothetical protein
MEKTKVSELLDNRLLNFSPVIHCESRDNSVSIVTALRAGRPGFDSREVQSLLSSKPRPDPLFPWGKAVEA